MGEAIVQQAGSALMAQLPSNAIGAEIYARHTAVHTGSPPNPRFSFPQSAGQSAHDAVASDASDVGNARDRTRPQDISVGTTPVLGIPSPSLFPPNPSIQSFSAKDGFAHTRGLGHRRSGSEFIGGDGSADGPGLMSSSSSNHGEALPSPPRSGRRRGHAHRRSGAISTHDLSLVLKPSKEPSARPFGSAPVTPILSQGPGRFEPTLDRSASQPAFNTVSFQHSASDDRRPSTSTPGKSRPRVEFSNKIEFIPRPLSIISSETEYSLSAMHASHSVTGSISSILSTDATALPATTVSNEDNRQPRPRAIDAASNCLPDEDPFGPRRPVSASGAALLNKRESSRTSARDMIDHDDETSPKARRLSRPVTPQSRSAPRLQADLQRLRGVLGEREPPTANDLQTSPEGRSVKRQRKVKSWAGFLSRKARSKERSEESSDAVSALGPLRDFAPLHEFSLDDVNFDEDTSCVVRTPGYESTSFPQTCSPKRGRRRRFSSATDDHAVVDVLDLDAAWDAVPTGNKDPSTAFGAKRRMHSSGSASALATSTVLYHRRTESAPSLSPTQFQSLDGRWLGSGSQMADVFEEDEDEDVPARALRPKANSCNLERTDPVPDDIGTAVVDTDSRRTEQPTDPKSGAAMPPDVEVEIADTSIEPRFSVVTKSSDESTITPQISRDPLRNSTMPDTVDPGTAPPMLDSEASTTVSPIPSPDPAATSFDVPRLHTATSSVTDRTAWSSPRAGEAGTAMSYSTEDVPSLTDSASTMTSGHPSQFPPIIHEPPVDERAFSLSATVPRIRRPNSAGGKRASLASLSRLVHSSHGEKSKLSIASSAPQEDTSSTEKKKGSRLGRLMRFWKSKEKLKG